MSDPKKVVEGGCGDGSVLACIMHQERNIGKEKNKQKTKTLSCYTQLWIKENGEAAFEILHV